MNQVDLNTVLLTIVLAISGWTLTTVLKHVRSLTQIEQQLWGKDGNNGHSSDIRQLRDAINRLQEIFQRMLRRIERLEERTGEPRRTSRDMDNDEKEGDR